MILIDLQEYLLRLGEGNDLRVLGEDLTGNEKEGECEKYREEGFHYCSSPFTHLLMMFPFLS